MADTMRAVVLRSVGDLCVEDLPMPQVDPGEVLIKTDLAGVCGTDVHMWAGTNFEGKFPFVPGHEGVGKVVSIGPGVKGLQIGDRVVGECFVPCHGCTTCQDHGIPAFCMDSRYFGFQPQASGSMAEYQVSPIERLFKVPDELSDEEACLVEPISVAYHAIWGRGGGVASHDRVGVFGAGPIGLFALQIAKTAGAQVIVSEPSSYRQEMAEKMGADVIVDPSKEDVVARVMELTGGLGLTRIIECSGSIAGIACTVDVIGVGGRIVLTGQSMGLKIPIELGKLIWKHAEIVGSCGSPRFFPKTLSYMSKKIVDVMPIITHRFPMEEAQKAFEMGNRATESGKILLEIGA